MSSGTVRRAVSRRPLWVIGGRRAMSASGPLTLNSEHSCWPPGLRLGARSRHQPGGHADEKRYVIILLTHDAEDW